MSHGNIVPLLVNRELGGGNLHYTRQRRDNRDAGVYGRMDRHERAREQAERDRQIAQQLEERRAYTEAYVRERMQEAERQRRAVEELRVAAAARLLAEERARQQQRDDLHLWLGGVGNDQNTLQLLRAHGSRARGNFQAPRNAPQIARQAQYAKAYKAPSRPFRRPY